jgi:hypothetical protein
MVHHRKSLSFRFETRHELPRIHPVFDDLERDTLLHWVLSLGEVNDSHPAFAELL